jgi:hypothetical protein
LQGRVCLVPKWHELLPHKQINTDRAQRKFWRSHVRRTGAT